MTTVSRRAVLGAAAAAAAVASTAKTVAAGTPPAGLSSITTSAQPITAQEREGRIGKVQSLLQQQRIGAFLVESGSSLEYFTGVRWHRSERVTAAIIPAEGRTVVVTPFFEQPSVRETLQIESEVRPWNEDENPFELIAAAARGKGHATGALAVEPTTRYFIIDGVTKAGGAGSVISGDQLVRACRMVKSQSELALMQAANNVTIAALRHVHGRIEAGMEPEAISSMMDQATRALGGDSSDFSLVLLNEASAYPHGSHQPQKVHEGSVILMDCGCTVHGYQSDISRTWVFGEPTKRQREVWDTVKRGQELALETAALGKPVGSIDKAVRDFYEQRGWRKNYGLPGLSHRTGHGIGMDGHEAPFLVRNDPTPLAAGMCFSDEPGIYIPGEFGIRLEDCWYMTSSGPKLFTALAKSIDQPF
ncbi:MAG TPA: Xaa-Pro peptidase family protein [Steroidobacteraceae bacterium]|nr:Xaa-Pro peptidase family protein [Steroidobacteraceae bacterium]